MTELAEIDAPEDLKAIADNCRAPVETRIATVEQFALVTDRIKTVKAALKRADEFFDPPIAQAFSLHKMLCQRKRVITDPLMAREKADKAMALDYQREEQAKAEKERARLQAIVDEKARVEREKAEQAAAKQRAIEAEARAKVEAAKRAEEEARRQAEAASAAKRKKLLVEAEAARQLAEAEERKAAAASAKVEVAEEKAAAVVTPVIAVASAAPKIKGISTSGRWKAEIVDMVAFISHCCEAKRFDLLLPNEKMLDGIAKSLNKMASIPGVEFKEVSSMAARGR